MTIEAKAWRIFSRYIRKSSANEFGFCTCVTCGQVKEWKKMDAGHFIDRQFKSVMYDERNVHPQCKICNRSKNGMPDQYRVFMKIKYGQSVIEELETRAASIWAGSHEQIYNEYKEKFKQL